MTDLHDSLQRIRGLSEQLNAVTDETNKVVAAVEKFLNEECKLGVPAYVTCTWIEGRNGEKVPGTELGYDRLNGKFRVVVRENKPSDSGPPPRPASVEITPWSERNRADKLETFSKLLALLSAELPNRVESVIKSADIASAAITQVLEALTGLKKSTTTAAPTPTTGAQKAAPQPTSQHARLTAGPEAEVRQFAMEQAQSRQQHAMAIEVADRQKAEMRRAMEQFEHLAPPKAELQRAMEVANRQQAEMMKLYSEQAVLRADGPQELQTAYRVVGSQAAERLVAQTDRQQAEYRIAVGSQAAERLVAQTDRQQAEMMKLYAQQAELRASVIGPPAELQSEYRIAAERRTAEQLVLRAHGPEAEMRKLHAAQAEMRAESPRRAARLAGGKGSGKGGAGRG